MADQQDLERVRAFRKSIKPTTSLDWERSDKYHNSFLIPKDEILDAAVRNSTEQGLPDIAVSRAQGKFLHLLAKSIGAKKILEVGTLGGYSTIWFARALPADGKLISLELSPHNGKVALENLKAAGVDNKVTIVIGRAAESLTKLGSEEPFDLVFIDADKASNSIYFSEAKRLLRKGGIIIVDNIVWNGYPADPEYTDTSGDAEGIRTLLKAIQGDEEVDATTIATVGERGYDGFLYAIKK